MENELIFVGENDICKFYTSKSTEFLTEYANKLDVYKDISLPGFRVLMTEQKSDGTKSLLLLDEKNNIVEDAVDSETMWVCIDRQKLLKQPNFG